MAVAGILFANVLVFFGHFAMPADLEDALPSAAADDVLTSIEVTVSEDQINYSKDRAENILRAILQRT